MTDDTGSRTGGADERTSEGTSVSTADVREAVATALPGPIEGLEPVEPGKNAVFEVSLGGGPVDAAAIKVGTRTPDRIPVEAVAIERVAAATDLPVPRVLGSAREGDPSNPLSAPYLLLERIPGRTPGPDGIDASTFERVCYEAGRNLGTLHRSIPVDGVGPLELDGGSLAAPASTDEWPTLYRRVVGSQLDDLDGTRFEDLRPAIEESADRTADALRGRSFEAAFVHMDYRLENLVLREGGPPATAGVLDWGGAAAAPPAYELAQTEAILVDSPAFDAESRASARDRFLEGYGETAGSLESRARDRRRRYRLPARLRLMRHLDERMGGRPREAVEDRAREHVRAVRRIVDRR